jgi:hypothetical protein
MSLCRATTVVQNAQEYFELVTPDVYRHRFAGLMRSGTRCEDRHGLVSKPTLELSKLGCGALSVNVTVRFLFSHSAGRGCVMKLVGGLFHRVSISAALG